MKYQTGASQWGAGDLQLELQHSQQQSEAQ